MLLHKVRLSKVHMYSIFMNESFSLSFRVKFDLSTMPFFNLKFSISHD